MTLEKAYGILVLRQVGKEIRKGKLSRYADPLIFVADRVTWGRKVVLPSKLLEFHFRRKGRLPMFQIKISGLFA